MSGRSVAIGVAIASLAACHRAPPPVMVSRPPEIPRQELSPPPALDRTFARGMPSALAAVDTATEEHVQVETYGREVDVRDILTFLGQRAGLRLVFAPGIDKKIRVSLADVPVSQAFQTVLSLANLTLEHGGGAIRRASSSSVVFYELPVNVDSLSVEAIMKRFGVGRSVAELVVEERTKRP